MRKSSSLSRSPSYRIGIPSLISFTGEDIVCDSGGGFRGGILNAEEVEGKDMVMGDIGGMIGVGSEKEVPAETKAGVVAQIWSSYIGSLQNPGMSMLIGLGVWSRGSLIESGVSGSGRRISSSIGDGVCLSASESMFV